MSQVAEKIDPDLVLGPEWRNVSKSKPRTPGWRAVRTQDMDYMEKDYYRDAYWEGGCWYVFGSYAGMLSVRQEVRNVEFWRPHTTAERAAIKKEMAKAVIPPTRRYGSFR